MDKLALAAWIAAAAIGVLIVVGFFRGWFRARRQGPIISLVLLLRQPRELDAAGLAAAASRALGTTVTAAEDPEATHFVAGEGTHFFLKLGGDTFMVMNFGCPYTEKPERAAAKLPDVRLGRALAEHKAWLSVDFLDDASAQEQVDAAYRTIGKLIAELAGEDSLAVYAPQIQRLNSLSPEVLAGLRGPDPLGAVAHLAHPPMVKVGTGDPEMKAAVAEARRRWPEFVAAFQQRKPGAHYAVKAPVTRGENTEFIWIDVTAIEGGAIRGTLGNEPVSLPGLALGSPVEVKLEDVNDWAYGDAEGVQGGFTVKVLARAARKAR